MQSRQLRQIASIAALAMTIAACGQRPGVHQEAAVAPVAQAPVQTAPSGGQGASAPTDAAPQQTATTAPAPTPVTGAAPVAPAAPASSAPGTAPSAGPVAPADPSAPRPEPSATAEAPPPASAQRQVMGQDRTGVTADTIVVGSHAPVTGAAPLPSTSFKESGDLWWRHFFAQGGDVLGRTNVEILFRDDKYDPNSAIQVCREMAVKAFILSAGGGTDQIQACGRLASVQHFPYFSAGVTEAGLRGNPWYFASSMSYKQQGLLMAKYLKREFAGAKIGAVIPDTNNFQDSVEGWEQGVEQQGLDYYATKRTPKGDTTWYAAVIGDMQQAGVEVIYTNNAPIDYIRMAGKAAEFEYDVQFVGPGVTNGLNAVLAGCPSVDGGIFFSPFPGLDWARVNQPAFFEAAAQFGVPDDDIAFALWGTNQVFHELLKGYGEVYGDDLTREDFRDFVETASVRTPAFPALDFSPTDHFGANQVHVLRANCAVGEYETLETFAASF